MATRTKEQIVGELAKCDPFSEWYSLAKDQLILEVLCDIRDKLEDLKDNKSERLKHTGLP